MAFFKKKTDVDMTTGSIPGHLIRFALPLLVGTISPIVNLFVSFFSGLSVGAGVLEAAAEKYRH